MEIRTVIEILQNKLESLILLAKQVLDRNLRILESDVRRTSSRGISSFDRASLHTPVRSFDEKHTHSLFGLNGGREIVGETSICDPLFRSINDIVLSVGRLLRSRLKTADIRTGKGLPAITVSDEFSNFRNKGLLTSVIARAINFLAESTSGMTRSLIAGEA